MAKTPGRITFDFETRSVCDLKKAGAYKYSLDRTTQPTCLAFKNRAGGEVKLIPFKSINKNWKLLPKDFREDWLNWIQDHFEFSAHNAFFETCIYKNILVKRLGWPDIPFEQFRCTAAKAAACALPRSLAGAGEALCLVTQKDWRGHAAVMATCKPTRQWNAWMTARQELAEGKKIGPKKRALAVAQEPSLFLEYQHNPATWETLYEYCRIDVLAEEQLDEALPDLIPDEQVIWFLNQRLNWKGLRVDIPTIQKIVSIMESESTVQLKELDTLTMGLVTKPGARQSILDFLKLEGIELPDIRAKTVQDVLAQQGLDSDVKRLLELRQALSKTSTKKYQAFLDRANTDSRVRDILLYSGASTGRDTGTGIQPHNFPKPIIRIDKDRPYLPVENVVRYEIGDLKLLYGENLSLLFSSILRNMIVPSPGCELFVADFSKIEVAVLWWLAENFKGLDILNAGDDPYIFMAAKNTGKTYSEIDQALNRGEKWAEDARQLGKAQILGAGFRMGWKRFKETAYDQYRLTLTNQQSVAAIQNYREANPTVVKLWDAYEEAAIQATENPRSVVHAGKCAFSRRGKFLWIRLPSGRKLAYLAPRIAERVFEYEVLDTDEKGKEIIVKKMSRPKKTLQHLGLAPNKKAMQVEYKHGGILTENIVQAVARDLMMPAMLRLEKNGFSPLLMVHDEGICESYIKDGRTIESFVAPLVERPLWADGHLPIEAKGWKGPRYRK